MEETDTSIEGKVEYLCSCVDKLRQAKVLVVGDIMLDIFMYGSVDRISPEAPVPVFRFKQQKEILGGAGNVVANLTSLGCPTSFIGIIGDDEEGQKIVKLLEQDHCKDYSLALKQHLTTVKTRIIASHNHLLRLDREVPVANMESIWPKLLENIVQEVPKADIVLLSDYGKGLFSAITTPFIVDICHRFEKPVLVDPKGNDYTKYNGVTLIKPNLKEFQEATGMTFDPTSKNFHDEVCRGARMLFDRCHIDKLLVTLSQYGMLCVEEAAPREVFQIPTEAREVFDVSGAGDTSFAMLGAALGAGIRIVDAMALASVASGIVVGKLGTSSVSLEELKTVLAQRISTAKPIFERQKLCSRNEINRLLAPLRKQGKTIGFTNGCFDCLHQGHLHSFQQAKKECDILVVGVNSDASIKRYKGPDRPIQDEVTRASVVAALEYVDFAVIFDDDSAGPLVELIRPDVIAKEGYTLDNWPEAQKVLSYGGRAVTLKRVEGASTTRLVEKMKGQK
ncbi:MAG: bifunctional heptose 7-phosphate kinase/heptose 1-phosphate adenyltransferase [Thermoguttaceae bacterium]|nr:bifunctional heptose 7-phosphate kinase/heptose 1-phosphate adenyltransferase [Thermoguttaceae bacterium]